jgi:hypothetical protein
MAEFTLLKLQVDDASFTANAPFSESEGDDSGEESAGGLREASGSARRLLPLVVGLGFLVVVALVVRKLRGRSDAE